jgi:hypothetical protein
VLGCVYDLIWDTVLAFAWRGLQKTPSEGKKLSSEMWYLVIW